MGLLRGVYLLTSRGLSVNSHLLRTLFLLFLASLFVLGSNVFPVKGLLAETALKGLLLEVSPLMVLHVSLGSECFATHLADEGFFVRVNSNVDLQVGSLREALVTSLVRASVGLRAVVEVVVGFESTFP